MEFTLEFSSSFEKSMLKIKRRDPVLFLYLQKKLIELCNHPEHFKPLRGELFGVRRIHFGSFVLLYSVEGKIVRVIEIDHHDQAY
jgi:addiction module RelE/StbE family toxin